MLGTGSLYIFRHRRIQSEWSIKKPISNTESSAILSQHFVFKHYCLFSFLTEIVVLSPVLGLSSLIYNNEVSKDIDVHL
jgi:hypothetical protein